MPSPLPSKGRSLSPEEEHMAIIAAVENVTGLVLDQSDADVFIKEESSSPATDDDNQTQSPHLKFKPATPQRSASPQTRPAKSSTQQQQPLRPAKHGGKAATVSKTVLARGPPTTGQAVIPRRTEDWEPWKAILHELYITQNRILRDIIGIMDTKHNLKATPKMYKNQFARWGFFKYAVKRRPRTKTESSPPSSSDDSSSSTELVRGTNSLMHASDVSRGMQAGLTAVRRFLHGHIDLDSANLLTEEVAGFVDPCYRYFKVAMDLFDLKENVEGGRVLRLAFLQIDRKVAKPTMKSFSDLCLLVPHLLLESGRRDILAAYLRYLSTLATLKFGNKHPVTALVASFAGMADRPDDMMRYIMALSQINADTIGNVPGMLVRTTQWARNQSLACQRTRERGGPEPAWQQSLLARDRHEHHMIRLEAQSVYWAQNLVMNDPDSDDLAEQWLRRRFEPGYGARCEAHLARLKERVAAGEFPPVFARMMESLLVGWLFDYHETVREWEKAFAWGRRGLELATDEQYAIWSIHLEDMMRRHGSEAEAEMLRKKRRAHGWLEQVRVEVDRLRLD